MGRRSRLIDDAPLVAYLRIKRGIRQSEFARALDISQMNVSRMELWRSKPSKYQIRKLARILRWEHDSKFLFMPAQKAIDILFDLCADDADIHWIETAIIENKKKPKVGGIDEG